MCAFLGCNNFYHQFVLMHASTAGPLSELLNVSRNAVRKGSEVKWNWNAKCSMAFHLLNEALMLHASTFDLTKSFLHPQKCIGMCNWLCGRTM